MISIVQDQCDKATNALRIFYNEGNLKIKDNCLLINQLFRYRLEQSVQVCSLCERS